MISRTEEKLKAAAEEFGKYVACVEIIPFGNTQWKFGKNGFGKIEEEELVLEQGFE